MLPNNDSSRLAIVAACVDLGNSVSSVEYPGFVHTQSLNGRVANIGTANGTWQADIYRKADELEHGASPEATITIPDSHNRTAEGIARYVVGTMAGLAAYRAYASAREQDKADRDERRARNRRS
jgi:hypothetical protein